MRRREFIARLGATASAATWPLEARAQQRLPVIGYLAFDSPDHETKRGTITEFRRGLSEAGYVEGRNVTVEYRWAEFYADRLPALAADLVGRRVDVIVAFTAPAVFAAKAATKSIPIVFQTAVDPVGTGLVASLNQPRSNLTGMSILLTALAAKRLQLLHEVVPAALLVGYLTNPDRAALDGTEATDLQSAARILGLHLLAVTVNDPGEFEGAFARLALEGAGALLVSGYQFFSRYDDQLVGLAARHRMPAIYVNRFATAAGGLMSYGPGDLREVWRNMGGYTGRILKGEKPADLPVQQITKVELAINLKTAKALGAAFPTALLVRADEVIE